MKISILTPSFNQGAFIEKNIQSILAQNYTDFEHIVIDGGSTDNTIAVLKKYPHLKWISEQDEGQSDALNKGFALATGDIVGWINSDDYYQEDIFRDVVSHFEDSNIQWIIGNVTFVYARSGIERHMHSHKITYKALLKNPDIVRQQGVFFRKTALDEVGGWNKEFYMVMDFDLWVRLSRKYPPKMVPKNYACFLWHADQKSSPKNTFRQISELNSLLIDNQANLLDRYRMVAKKIFYLAKSVAKNFLISIGLVDERLSTIPFSASRIEK